MCNFGHRLLEALVLFEEGRGRLGPDDQIGMRGIRRTGDLAVWRAGLRQARDVRFAVFAAEFDEVGDVPLEFAGREPVAGVLHVEIGLDQNGGCGSRRFWRRVCQTGKSREEQTDPGDGAR